MAFKHASAERSETSSIWAEVETQEGLTGYGESCPRPYVTGESQASAKAFYRDHLEDLRENITSLDSLKNWLAEHRSDIDSNPAAWCALELAMLDALGKSKQQSVEQLLCVDESKIHFAYTAVLGDMDRPAFAALCQRYVHLGFRDFKVKLSGDAEKDNTNLSTLASLCPESHRLRFDANNLWHDVPEVIDYLDKLDSDYFAIEEPLPAEAYDNLLLIHQAIGQKIILDESFVRDEQFAHLKQNASAWIINIRVSKMGGLLRSLNIIEQAKELGIPIIIGAQVGETSLLTRAALVLARQASDQSMAQEGAVGTYLLSEDCCEPPLMFSEGGILKLENYSLVARSGFGLQTHLKKFAQGLDEL